MAETYIIIPDCIKRNTSLSSTSKILYGQILSLSNKVGKCWAHNKTLAEMIGVNERTISRCLKELKDFELVKVDTCRQGVEVVQRDIFPLILLK